MSNVFHRSCHQTLPFVSHGDGVYLFDNNGTRYLDACGGAAVSNLGHNNQEIKNAMAAQLDAVAFAHTGFFTNQASEALAETLCAKLPENFNRVYFVSGGSEAVESALKMARQYFVETGKPNKTEFIARKQSYHGNTLGALSVGGNEWRRDHFRPLFRTSHFIDPCYAYRYQQDDETEEAFSLRMANQLEAKILELGEENVMAFIAEPVVGATSGAVPATSGYFKRIREICDKYDVLLILDEVMCGVARTGTFFAFEQEQATPDIICLAKGLAAGYQPIGATIANDRVYDAMANGTGFFQHGHTFMAHPMACAAGLATLDYIQDHNLIEHINRQGEALKKALVSELSELQNIGDIRGKGLFLGIELVADKATKKPLDSSTQAHKLIQKEAMNNGLMCYPMSGTIDGSLGHHILLAPHFIITDQHIDELTSKLKLSILNVSKGWR